jgi:hypothetical protein
MSKRARRAIGQTAPPPVDPAPIFKRRGDARAMTDRSPALEGARHRWWERHGQSVLIAASVAMAAAALWRIGNAVPELLWDDGALAAFDLRLRHREVHRWFAGLEVYGDVERGDYPPASYVLLWPLMGWLDLAHTRFVWALTSLLALVWLARMFLRASGAGTWPERALFLLLPFSVYATSAAISLGQVSNHSLALVLAGSILLAPGRSRWQDDLAAASLLLIALVKPTLAAPFFWLALFVPGRLRPASLIVLGYIGLTVFAIAFQSGGVLELALGWLGEGPQVLRGHANFPKILAQAGLREWVLPSTLIFLSVHGLWVHRHRASDLWLLIGVSALVARLFIPHRLYDDMLVLLPMIALFQVAKGADATSLRLIAGVLFTACWMTVHAPASVLTAGGLLAAGVEIVQGAIWLATLVFLMVLARRNAQVAAVAEHWPAPRARRDPGEGHVASLT